jgi:hypothetical protein
MDRLFWGENFQFTQMQLTLQLVLEKFGPLINIFLGGGGGGKKNLSLFLLTYIQAFLICLYFLFSDHVPSLILRLTLAISVVLFKFLFWNQNV